MTGAERSVLGRDVDAVVEKFRTGLPRRFTVIETGIRMDFAIISYNVTTGQATDLKNYSRMSSI
jgi:calcineurin-like phosphoesterase